MNTKLLRQQILDLAIRGKLVKQDPNDEPASVLLERIRAEKEQLIQQGKIKKTKASATTDTPHYQNIPFAIPESWQWVKLGEIYNHNTGKALNSKDKEGRLMDYITTSNLYWNRFELEVVKQMPFADKDLERCVITKGDLLVCEGGDIGRAAIWNYDYDICIQNHIHRLRGKLQLCNLFYYYVFYEYKLTNRISSKGTTIQGLSSKEIDTLLIPLPPLAEQKRIVAEIEKWFALIDELDANKQDLQGAIKQVRTKVLDLAIHGKLVPQDPNDEPAIDLLHRINPHFAPSDTSHYQNVPQGWEVTTLENVCKIVTTQKYQIKQSEIKEAGKYPVISQSANYIEGYCDRADKLYTKSPVVIFGDHTRAVKFIDFEFVVGADGVKIFIPLLSPKYTYYLICYAASQIENKGYARHYSLLSKVPLFIPPLKEQKRIVNAIDAILEVMDIISAEL